MIMKEFGGDLSREQELQREQKELTDLLNRAFYAVLRVDLPKNTVRILQNRDNPQHMRKEWNWDAYLEFYKRILTEQGAAKLQECLTAKSLLDTAESGSKDFSFDVSYIKDEHTNWLTLTVLFNHQDNGDWQVYIFVRQNNEEHLLRSIIDLYVYNTCDYFIYLDMRHNSYVMFSGSSSGTPLPPAVCEDYETAIVDYARAFVVPEDQEMTIEKMHLANVRRQLADKEVYTFTAGVEDPQRGYTRKLLTYRYYDRKAQMVLLSRTDVTEVYLEERARQKELQAARLRAETDPLTGLLNYGGMSARVEKALAEDSGLSALLFLDMDNFKQVNDTLGHQAGDKLLWKVAQILQLQTDEEDYLGRVGGDEFVIFLRNVRGRKQAEDCTRRICEAVNCLSLPENGPHSVSCSIGGAMAPDEGRDYRTLAGIADRRAYQSKSLGKNHYLLCD